MRSQHTVALIQRAMNACHIHQFTYYAVGPSYGVLVLVRRSVILPALTRDDIQHLGNDIIYVIHNLQLHTTFYIARCYTIQQNTTLR